MIRHVSGRRRATTNYEWKSLKHQGNARIYFFWQSRVFVTVTLAHIKGRRCKLGGTVWALIRR